jgi:hypothetical protein
VSAFLCVVMSCVGRGLASGRSPTNCLKVSQVKTPRHRKVKRGRFRKKERKKCRIMTKIFKGVNLFSYFIVNINFNANGLFRLKSHYFSLNSRHFYKVLSCVLLLYTEHRSSSSEFIRITWKTQIAWF